MAAMSQSYIQRRLAGSILLGLLSLASDYEVLRTHKEKKLLHKHIINGYITSEIGTQSVKINKKEGR